MSSEFLIGADPEVFLKDEGGNAVSAHGVIKGTKETPFPVTDGAYQVDGMATEFNIDPVPLFNNGTSKGFIAKIQSVMKQLEVAVKEADKTYKLELSPIQEFDEEYLKKQPDEAKELGCNPDYNAYTKEQNPRPNGEAVNFRTASGHIHFGWGSDIPIDHPDHLDICFGFVKMLDLVVGLYMTIIDDDPRRRELYGKAGACRPKTYGVEYRTPSNVWLKNTKRMRAIYLLSQQAINLHMDGRTPSTFGSSFEEVQDIINSGDFVAAFKILHSIIMKSYVDKNLRIDIKDEFHARCMKEKRPEEYERFYPSLTNSSMLNLTPTLTTGSKKKIKING